MYFTSGQILQEFVNLGSHKAMKTEEAGKLGGHKRAANMTARARKASARKAAKARWDRQPHQPTPPRDKKPNRPTPPPIHQKSLDRIPQAA